ncbi:hypothetical protein [Chitinophaga eiseniae]|uniref:Uncharacterized protein n=1 Tax=Chitinophaga eiseniae TaxID=634771 RepID=A0A847SDW1_9BACT|nr:hypothetical protein [Chitinophaga eiseniae]NLR77145.1 hypothetical protein [Chitinophaga eiseniae]
MKLQLLPLYMPADTHLGEALAGYPGTGRGLPFTMMMLYYFVHLKHIHLKVPGHIL